MPEPTLDQLLAVCQKVAAAGAEILMAYRDKFTTREKTPKDLVTDADLASQEKIRELLAQSYPDHDFLGEEDAAAGTVPPRKSPYRWIVDPLDGTANYVHGLNSYSTSVAVEKNGEILAGVVIDPVIGETYSAALGLGARLNGKPLAASRCQVAREAMVAVSFRSSVPRGSIEISRFVEALHATQTMRRLGSAALNMCYVAAGRLDAYFATSGIKIWDVAAGLVIAREAGAVVTHINNGPVDFENPVLLASATPALHSELLEVLSRAEGVE